MCTFFQGQKRSPRRPVGHARPEIGVPICGLFLGVKALRCWLAVASIAIAVAAPAHGQLPTPMLPRTSEAIKIDRLEQTIDAILEENRRLSQDVQGLKDRLNRRQQAAAETTHGLESPATESLHLGDNSARSSPISVWEATDQPAAESDEFESFIDRFRVAYDNGFTIVPDNPEETPFSLKVNSQNMFRYDGFARGATSWIDSAGNENPITSSSNFQIPRGRLIFSGNALLPQLSYLLNIDYNTVTSNPIGFRAYELGYRFNRAVELYVGQSKVPGSREWLESAFSPLQGPDRTMATTFFRPSLSQGIWIMGEPVDHVYYRAMMSNGFNTINQRPIQLDNRFCWSGTAWWEPWGDFGRGYADLESHETPAVRLGASYTFALGAGSQSGGDAVENALIRLSDGTLITQPGAFAPGITLQKYDISLAAIDFAFKYRGLSLSTEWYLQDLSSLAGNGPLPITSTQAYGGFLQAGYFVLPQTVELYSRASFVTGHYGSGSELAGGLNWFILPGKSNLRFTFDTAWLDNSPADQNRTGFVAGQTGLLVRSQVTVSY